MTISLLWLLFLLPVGILHSRPTNVGRMANTESCNLLELVPRAEWGAKEAHPMNGGPFRSAPKRVFVHQAWDGRSCADLDSCSIRLQAIQAYHQHTKGWPDIGYSFLIAADGTVYEGSGFSRQGYHTLNYNQESLGVALIGTFQNVLPTQRMEQSLDRLLKCASQSGYLDPNYSLHGHRDARCTICPGDAAYSRISRMAHFVPGPLSRYSCPAGFQANLSAAFTSAAIASELDSATIVLRPEPDESHKVPYELTDGRSSRRTRQAPAEKAAVKRTDQPSLLVTQTTSSSGDQQLYLLTKTKSLQKNNLLLLRPATLVTLSSPQSSSQPKQQGHGSSSPGADSSPGASAGGPKRGGSANSAAAPESGGRPQSGSGGRPHGGAGGAGGAGAKERGSGGQRAGGGGGGQSKPEGPRKSEEGSQ